MRLCPWRQYARTREKITLCRQMTASYLDRLSRYDSVGVALGGTNGEISWRTYMRGACPDRQFAVDNTRDASPGPSALQGLNQATAILERRPDSLLTTEQDPTSPVPHWLVV